MTVNLSKYCKFGASSLLVATLSSSLLLASHDVIASSYFDSPFLVVGSDDYYLSYSLFVIFTFIVTFLSTKKILSYEFGKKIKMFDKDQTEGLVSSFKKMVDSIEGRDSSLKEQKEHAEKANVAKNDFLISVSHELRTPMHAILSISEMGQKRADKLPPAKIKEYFSRIENSAERLMILIDNILDLAKLESGQENFDFKSNNIESCIKGAMKDVSQLAEDKNVQIDLKIDAGQEVVVCDYNKIAQVVINLLSNAIRFSDVDMSISVNVSKGDFKNAEGRWQSGAVISVKDQGLGIAKEDADVIFNKFIQGNNSKETVGGSGVGLAICKEIVSAHNGKIWASKECEQGAEVIFTINNNLKETKEI